MMGRVWKKLDSGGYGNSRNLKKSGSGLSGIEKNSGSGGNFLVREFPDPSLIDFSPRNQNTNVP